MRVLAMPSIPLRITAMLVAAVLLANLLVPPVILSIWQRDGDTGCWFCGGVVLAQLAVLGVLGRSTIGTFDRRLLTGAAASVLCITTACVSFAMTGPVGRDDAAALLSLLLTSVIAFAVGDTILLTYAGRAIGAATAQAGDTDRPGFSRVNPDTHSKELGMRFGMASILGLTALAAMVACLWRVGLLGSEIGQRDIRSYVSFPSIHLLTMAIYLYALHIALLWTVMLRGRRASVWITVALCSFGLEAMRWSQEYWTVWKLDYLNWEFPLVVFGFVVAHIVIGSTARCFGLELIQINSATRQTSQ